VSRGAMSWGTGFVCGPEKRVCSLVEMSPSLETSWCNYRPMLRLPGRVSSVPGRSVCPSVLVCPAVCVALGRARPEEQLGQLGAALTPRG